MRQPKQLVFSVFLALASVAFFSFGSHRQFGQDHCDPGPTGAFHHRRGE